MNNLNKALKALGISKEHSELIKEGVELDNEKIREEYKKEFEFQREEERKKEEESRLNFSKMGLRERQELYINNKELYDKLVEEEKSKWWN